MFRTMAQGSARFHILNDGVELDVSGLSYVRGQLELEIGSFGFTGRVGFEFNLSPTGGEWFEPDTATRLDAEEISGPIDCRGYARCRLVVVTAELGDATGRLTLSGYGDAPCDCG